MNNKQLLSIAVAGLLAGTLSTGAVFADNASKIVKKDVVKEKSACKGKAGCKSCCVKEKGKAKKDKAACKGKEGCKSHDKATCKSKEGCKAH